MKFNKATALIGGAVLGGVSVLAAATAYLLRKKKRNEAETNELLKDLLCDAVRLREALIRSYIAGNRLREEHWKMRQMINAMVGENPSILEDVGETPDCDPFVAEMAEKAFSEDPFTSVEFYCEGKKGCVGDVCPFYSVSEL